MKRRRPIGPLMASGAFYSKRRRIPRKSKMGATKAAVTIPTQKALVGAAKPAWIKSTLIYYDTVTITSNAGAVAVHVFGSNCLFDPDITGTGHQPAGFDQYMALYQRYTVLKTRAKVTFFNESGVSFLVGMVATDEATALTDERQYIERGDNNWTSLGVDGTPRTLTMEIDHQKMNARSIWTDTVYSGEAGSNPTDRDFLHIFAQGASGNNQSVRVRVELQFDTAFRESAYTIVS